jgi:hypothetical protein
MSVLESANGISDDSERERERELANEMNNFHLRCPGGMYRRPFILADSMDILSEMFEGRLDQNIPVFQAIDDAIVACSIDIRDFRSRNSVASGEAIVAIHYELIPVYQLLLSQGHLSSDLAS